MKLDNLIKKLAEAINPHPSLIGLKYQFREKFDIPEFNIKVMKDQACSSKTGYLELPKKDDLCESIIEKTVTEFYSQFGFNVKTPSGKDSFCLENNDKKQKYAIRIIREERNYFLDIDRI